MPTNLENSETTGLEKLSFHSTSKERAVLKNVQTIAQLHSFHMLAINSKWTEKFQMFKLDLEKAEEPEIKLPTSIRSAKKQERSRKTSTSALLTMPKPLTAWITTNGRKFFKRWEYQTTWPASWEICMQVKKQQLQPDM